MYVERCKTFKKHFKETVKIKFKKMTQKQRDWGKVISLAIVAAVLLIGALSSCSPQLYKNNNKINVTHVLAVTEMGDTLKIPIEAIKPNVIYNIMGYDYMRPSYYFRPYNYTYDYYPYNYRPKPNNNVNNNNNSINIPIRPSNSTPNPIISTPPNPAKSKSKRNN